MSVASAREVVPAAFGLRPRASGSRPSPWIGQTPTIAAGVVESVPRWASAGLPSSIPSLTFYTEVGFDGLFRCPGCRCTVYAGTCPPHLERLS